MQVIVTGAICLFLGVFLFKKDTKIEKQNIKMEKLMFLFKR